MIASGTDSDSQPRKRDANRTKLAILQAGKEAFATKGYALAGVRGIAAAAGANAALVPRYFGSKKGLYEAALKDALDATTMIAGKRENFGVDIARLLLDRPPTKGHALPMIILSAGDPISAEVATRLLSKRILRPLATWVGTETGWDRAMRVSMVCCGLLTFWRLIPFRSGGLPIATRRWFERTLQAIVDGPD